MIRKQIFITERQDEALKRLARRTGKSEGALVRDAIALKLRQDETEHDAWEELLQEWANLPADGGPRDWTREQLHEREPGHCQ